MWTIMQVYLPSSSIRNVTSSKGYRVILHDAQDWPVMQKADSSFACLGRK